MIFYVAITTRRLSDVKDRMHRFYVAEVASEAEAREVMRQEESHLFYSVASTVVKEIYEAQPPGPAVINIGIALVDRTRAAR